MAAMKVPNPAALAASATAACSTSAYQSKISSLASSIQARVLKPMSGSGNYGESGPSAFYTIDKLPSVLEDMKGSAAAAVTTNSSIGGSGSVSSSSSTKKNKLERLDLDLGPNRLAFYIDDVLTTDEADALASCAEAVLEANGHSRTAPGIRTPSGMRINEAAHWYPPHTSKFLGSVLERFRPLVPESLGGLPLHPKLSEKVAQFKYNKGDRFNRHIDGLFPGQGANPQGDGIDEWTGVVSGMSMLFFLNDKTNDGLVGGETRLWSADGTHYVDVEPRKGRVLFFRRGSRDAVLHAGLEVTGDVPKYISY